MPGRTHWGARLWHKQAHHMIMQDMSILLRTWGICCSESSHWDQSGTLITSWLCVHPQVELRMRRFKIHIIFTVALLFVAHTACFVAMLTLLSGVQSSVKDLHSSGGWHCMNHTLGLHVPTRRTSMCHILCSAQYALHTYVRATCIQS